jgi:large subunit ribosomal protein L31
MKAEIHPEFNTDAKVKCACGQTFTIGSTQKEIEVEICSNCHPFYTGVDKIVDTAGRVEKFKMRREAATPGAKKAKKTKVRKTDDK